MCCKALCKLWCYMIIICVVEEGGALGRILREEGLCERLCWGVLGICFGKWELLVSGFVGKGLCYEVLYMKCVYWE